MNKSQAFSIYGLIASVLVVTSVLALITTQQTIPGTGVLQTVGVEVYGDKQCTNATSSINVGLVTPGSSKSFTLYLKNVGNSILTLNMTSKNWSPSTASNYMTFTWNREGQEINPNQVISFVITLSVSSSVQGINSFSFELVVTGTAD